MNKEDLIKKIDSTWLSVKRKNELKEAVDSFEDALLRQYTVSGRSEQLCGNSCDSCTIKDGIFVCKKCGKK
jgi:hypothetical protein